jgi:Flp pilus assembly protein TadG
VAQVVHTLHTVTPEPSRGLLKRCRRFKGEAGATLIEAALIIPLLMLFTFGTIDFASLFYAYLALENGISQATRFAVTGNQMNDPANPGNLLSRTASIETAMRQATPTLTLADTAFTFTHMPSGGGGWIAGVGGPSDIEKVSVNYTWTILTPIIRPFFTGGQITLHAESAMKNEGRFN